MVRRSPHVQCIESRIQGKIELIQVDRHFRAAPKFGWVKATAWEIDGKDVRVSWIYSFIMISKVGYYVIFVYLGSDIWVPNYFNLLIVCYQICF